ncbi:MAG: zinc ribbon domain-containing protein [Candidatus Bathyarchaeota archaeon]|nr:zinc ribbon domain-containing protein [Candidatus Bathyarchaeota archaeon]
MPYCRKCGTKLDENARFCYVCGTPVAAVTPTAVAAKPAAPRRPMYIGLAAVLISVVLVAIVVSALIFLPITPVNFTQTNSVAAETGVNRLNLNLQADIVDVNIIPQRVNGNTVFLNVSATGSTGIFGSATPIKLTFTNETSNNAITVTASITRIDVYFTSNLHVTCNVYVDPKIELNLTARTSVGQIVMNARDQTIQNLVLQATTGSVKASLGRNVVLTGNVSTITTTGSVTLDWEQADAKGNITVNVKSTTGTASVKVNRNFMLAGNVSIEAGATTGSVNFEMTIHDDVSAQIESSKVLGVINVQQDGFSGGQELLRSNNYPAPSNFNVKLSTITGNVNIDATYQSSATRS